MNVREWALAQWDRIVGSGRSERAEGARSSRREQYHLGHDGCDQLDLAAESASWGTCIHLPGICPSAGGEGCVESVLLDWAGHRAVRGSPPTRRGQLVRR